MFSLKCRTSSQSHRVRQLPQVLSSKRWVRGPLWGGRGATFDQHCAGVLPGVCKSSLFMGPDSCIYIEHFNVIGSLWVFFFLLFTCSKAPVTSSFAQTRGALAANWSTLSITSRPVCLTCAAAPATPAAHVSAAHSLSSLDSVPMQEGSHPTGEAHSSVVMFAISVNLFRHFAWFALLDFNIAKETMSGV